MEANKTKAALLLSLMLAVALCSGCSNNQSAPAVPAAAPLTAAQTQQFAEEHAQQQQVRIQQVQNSNMPAAVKQKLLQRLAAEKPPAAN